MEEREKIARLQEMVDQSHGIVFFGGAGVSTESGIPDFRSTDGLYHQQYAYPPETILSHTFYERKSEEFFRFTGTSSCVWMLSPMQPTRSLRSWNRPESCGL